MKIIGKTYFSLYEPQRVLSRLGKIRRDNDSQRKKLFPRLAIIVHIIEGD